MIAINHEVEELNRSDPGEHQIQIKTTPENNQASNPKIQATGGVCVKQRQKESKSNRKSQEQSTS